MTRHIDITYIEWHFVIKTARGTGGNDQNGGVTVLATEFIYIILISYYEYFSVILESS